MPEQCPCCRYPWDLQYQDPACQSSPTYLATRNLNVKLASTGYWRNFNSYVQFGWAGASWTKSGAVWNFSRSRNKGAPYDRTELCNSRHGSPLFTTDANLLTNAVTGNNQGGAIPFGQNITITVTNNAATESWDIVGVWSSDWTSPRWKIVDELTVDGVNVQGYVTHCQPHGAGHKLRWFFGDPSDNPDPSADPQDGASGTDYYDPSTIDWCRRNASFAFGGSGPTAEVTWDLEYPRQWWWNNGDGGVLIPMATDVYSGTKYWIPDGGSAESGALAGFDGGSVIEEVRNDAWNETEAFLDPATGTAGVNWWYDFYPQLLVNMPDMSWAGGTSGEIWREENPTNPDWQYRLQSNPVYSPQTAWTWDAEISFYDTGGGLSAWEVFLLLTCYDNGSGGYAWAFTSTIDFSTHFEDEIYRTANFTLTNDASHPSDGGFGTGAQTLTKFYGAPADYSFTMPTSFAIEFDYRFLVE